MKYIGKILIFCTLAATLAGCTLPSPPPAATERPSEVVAYTTPIRPGPKPAPTDVALRIITEDDNMKPVAEKLASEFQSQHKNVTVNLEYLPQESRERDHALETLRQEIAEGNGPDGFLLPTHTFQNDLTCSPLKSLFPSAAEAMDNGTFLDVSRWYDTDEVLASINYRQEVLKAGRVDGKQYLLPLFYNFPVLYQVQTIPGLKLDLHGIDIDDLFEDVLEIGNSTLAAGVFPTFLAHGEGCNLLTVGEDHDEDLQELLQSYGALQTLAGDNSWFETGVTHYLLFGQCLDDGYPMSLASLAVAMDYAAIAKSQGQQLFMNPVCNDDGELVASITRYAAVSASSRYPELTYQFLRTFLDESAQVGELQKPADRNPRTLAWGYPVLDYNTAAALWEHNFAQYLSADGSEPEKALSSVQITDEDIPVLACKITRVRIPNTNEDWALNQAFHEHNTDHVNDNTNVAHNYQEPHHEDKHH